jgi:hypothetical protein
MTSFAINITIRPDQFSESESSQLKADITILPSCYEPDAQRGALV